MAQQREEGIRTEAVQWHVRLRNGGEPEDWEAFMRWLEADPARSDAYDQVKFADAAIEPDMVQAIVSPAAPVAANDPGEPADPSRARKRTRHWATAFAAVAAIFLVGFIALPWLTAGQNRYEVATAAGERRTVSIDSGSSAMLNGATRLVLDRDNPRFAELAAGEATFTVRHDAARPFLVVAGKHRVEQVGTIFNLVRDSERFSVEVIEGAVLYNPQGESVSLAAGQTLLVREGAGARPVIGRREPQAMAGWQRGQLSYRAAPLETVASDLSRYLGSEVALAPDLGTVPFTGSIHIEGDGGASVTDFASTLGLEARRIGDRWLIEPPSRAPR